MLSRRSLLRALPALLATRAFSREGVPYGPPPVAGYTPVRVAPHVHATVRVSSRPAGPLPRALLGHYDLSGPLFGYDRVPGLVEAMRGLVPEWRVGVGRWELGTRILPALTDGTPCSPVAGVLPPEAQAPAGSTDATLVADRDWFSDDGRPVTLAMTADASRYRLGWIRRAVDVAAAFGAEPFVSIDLMPRALSASREFARTRALLPDACLATFSNRVSNVRPADPAVFAAAVEGLVSRVVLGSDGEAPRPVRRWEVWNEPEFAYFWDPSFDELPSLTRYFEMAALALVRLDAWRRASADPRVSAQRFGLGSFANAETAARAIQLFDALALPGGGRVPIDFVSFHSYANDPLAVARDISIVAAARQASTTYRNAELVLAEWGPDLSGVGWDESSMDLALHAASVIALGAAAGLGRAHRTIFWDYYGGDLVRMSLLDRQLRPRPVYHAYTLLSALVAEGAERLELDSTLDPRDGAALASRSEGGERRLLLVNTGSKDLRVRVEVDGVAVHAPCLLFDEPFAAPREACWRGLLPRRSIALLLLDGAAGCPG